ncbi:MAG: ABC transporter permease [Rickettsiaceae bacterium]|nr:ABC transporter permease [Rickettsiaceae bacterium]
MKGNIQINRFKQFGTYLVEFARLVGEWVLKGAENIGSVTLFTSKALIGLFKRPFHLQNFVNQLIFIGFYSLPVVGMTAIFSGAVLALQSYTGFSRFSAESTIATVVALSITRELGPVLAGLMVAGRVGASIAAEIGTMRVTEQIDALYTLSTDPIKYLVTPRIIAGIISLPCLVVVADIIGIMGGYLVSVVKLDFNPAVYVSNTFQYLRYMDVISGLVKACVFGFIITSVSSFCGFYCEKGARGVGSATTKAVVSSSILILLSNYFLTEIFF